MLGTSPPRRYSPELNLRANALLSPGRFFAANELKAMMAYVVVSYDVKFEKEGVRPENIYAALGISPDPNARVLFKKRDSITSG